MKLTTHTKITFPADRAGAMMFDVMVKAGLLQPFVDSLTGEERFGTELPNGKIEAATVCIVGLAAAYDKAVQLPRSVFNVSVRPMLESEPAR